MYTEMLATMVAYLNAYVDELIGAGIINQLIALIPMQAVAQKTHAVAGFLDDRFRLPL